MDLRNVCRCCLVKGNKMRSIQATVFINRKPKIISNIIETCLNVTISSNEDYPQNICYSCIDELQTAYYLKTKIEKNSKVISKHVEQLQNVERPTKYIEITKNDFLDDIEEEALSSEPVKAEEEVYNCLLCSVHFPTPQLIYEHCRENHKPVNAKGKYECKFCLEHFSNMTLVTKHRRRHITPQYCPWCWDDITDYDSHTLTCKKYQQDSKKGVKSREIIPCYHCGKSYPKDYLRIHLLTHGPDIVKCHLCNRGFKVKGNLATHMKNAHSQDKPHKCPYCDKTFKMSSFRTRHIREDHMKERNKKCKECGKVFFLKCSLRRHMFVHTGEKIYKCQLCDKAYQYRRGLKVHNKTKHGKDVRPNQGYP